MPPPGHNSGLLVRSFLPGAAKVEIVPVHEKSKPKIALQKIDPAGVFEGVSKESKNVYAYDLIVTYEGGHKHQFRDPYSFLPTLGEMDLYLFGQGNEFRIYDKLGSHLRNPDGVAGVGFAVWAPNAQRVSVVGVFNNWDGRVHSMRMLGSSGIWEIFIPGLGEGTLYKYEIKTLHGHLSVKTDPYGTFYEVPPKNASIVWNTEKFKWTDSQWLDQRGRRDPLRSPMSIYEVHLGSWRKKTIFEGFSYRELADQLVDYVKKIGFTHVE